MHESPTRWAKAIQWLMSSDPASRKRTDQGTELRQAIAAAQMARLNAEAAQRATTDFLATLAHELRTPLTSISGFTDLLTRKGHLSLEQRRYISLIRIASESLSTIVSGILDFSKVEAGHLEPRSRTISLATAAQPRVKFAANAEDAALCRGRILLVDDIETNREIVMAYLEDGGCDVVQAGSGAEALRLLEETAFDLVLMDIQMPDMDGVTATRLIRQMKAPVRDIPVLAMTGNVLPRQIQSFINAGMNDHLGKPIERKKLYSKLWCWLPRKIAAEPAALASSPMFNHTRLDELIDSLGPRKVEHTLRMFQKQLGDCFQSDIAQARREAHDLINAAGVLGFELLLDYALALKDTPDALPVSDALMADCRDTRDAVLEIITAIVLPYLAAPEMRKAG